MGDYYTGGRLVLTNIFGTREVMAYVTSSGKENGTKRLFFSTILPAQLQIFYAWQEKTLLNKTGSEWMQYIPLLLYSFRWDIEVSCYEQKSFWSLCAYMVRSRKRMETLVNLNYSYDSLNCFSLVLTGEPYLNHILEKQVHEVLRQRITVHYNYEGLSDKEIPEYIRHKLELAGASRQIMEPEAVSAVHGYSEGNVRKIDNLMTDALTIGAQQGKTVIDTEVILAAANNQSLT